MFENRVRSRRVQSNSLLVDNISAVYHIRTRIYQGHRVSPVCEPSMLTSRQAILATQFEDFEKGQYPLSIRSLVFHETCIFC